jgi:IclR family transcriptional regulator, mhp operon transcriptional activator
MVSSFVTQLSKPITAMFRAGVEKTDASRYEVNLRDKDHGMDSFKPLKSVEKTLNVLELLNRFPIVRVKDIVEQTDMPSPTVIRILETLVRNGYVRHVGKRAGYCVTERIQALSAGNHGLPSIFDSARAEAEKITVELLWPTAIATLDTDSMVVRFSTIPHSPLSHKHSTINRRLSLIDHAHGRAYLAFCAVEEQKHLIGLLERAAPDRAEDIRQRAQRAIAETRAIGIGQRDPLVEPDTRTIALPLMVGIKVVGTIGVTYFTRSKVDRGALRAALERAVKACAT